MKRLISFIIVSNLALVFAVLYFGQDAPLPPEQVQVEEDAAAFHYSPYVVALAEEADVPYDRISFKDVGMSLPEGRRSAEYEQLADQVAESLSSTLNVTAQSDYDGSLLDPNSHLACGAHHVYVDLWHQASTDTWGYSLWSGCSAEDEFAAESAPVGSEEDVRFEALAEQIATSLQTAQETNCFSRNC